MDDASNQPPNGIGLSQLAVGARARVLGYRPCDDDYARRLQSLGLTPGTEIVLRRYAPLGDPAEILFRGTRVAIRPAEAECLLLEAL
jgi:ferrous iron transport protein A